MVEGKSEEIEMTEIGGERNEAALEEGKFSADMNLYLYESGSRHYYLPYWYSTEYTVYDRRTKSLTPVVSKDGSTGLQFCEWVKNVALVYVSNNNIYWREKWNGDPESDIAITTDGINGFVLNGILDWHYPKAYSDLLINEKATRLTWVQFNMSLMPMHHFPMYGEPENILENQYPKYKYRH